MTCAWSDPRTGSTATGPPTSPCSWPSRPAPTRANSPPILSARLQGDRRRHGRGHRRSRLPEHHRGRRRRRCARQGHRRGRRRHTAPTTALAGHVVNMEFVSANPTGPLHIGHTRWAALGDSIARVLRASGAEVTAEYYINDAGTQMNVFANSVYARLHGRAVPEGGYPGEYIADLGHEVLTEHPDIRELTDVAALPVIRAAAYQAQLKDIQDTLADFGVDFDVFFSEQELHDAGAIEKCRCPPARAGPRVRRRRCRLAAHHRLRRRQGPRDDPRQRRAHLLRRGRRLLPVQEGPRLHREDLPARRRPPRLHQPAQGHRGLPRATTPRSTSRC